MTGTALGAAKAVQPADLFLPSRERNAGHLSARRLPVRSKSIRARKHSCFEGVPTMLFDAVVLPNGFMTEMNIPSEEPWLKFPQSEALPFGRAFSLRWLLVTARSRDGGSGPDPGKSSDSRAPLLRATGKWCFPGVGFAGKGDGNSALLASAHAASIEGKEFRAFTESSKRLANAGFKTS
jgi:hypothetical protein